VSGSDGLRHEPTKAGRLSIRRARPKNARQQGLLKLPLLVYMLSVVREDNARLGWLKGKKWGNPAGGDRILS
jgi:hypothetical protein